jgi:hypothetical protein
MRGRLLKKEVKKVIRLMYLPYKNEYIIFKPVQIIISRGLR